MPMSEALTTLGEKIVAGLGGAATGHSIAFDQLTVTVRAEKIVDVVKFLRDDPALRFVSFIDVTAVDYPGREKRFDVVYHLLSPTLNARIRLRAVADETTQVPSIIEVFPGADWFERECYDLYGVIFTGHPDMRRLLTDYGFDGHPLRKDFPGRRVAWFERHSSAALLTIRGGQSGTIRYSPFAIRPQADATQ